MGQLNAGIVPVTPFQQNCTILFDMETKAGVVVDPGGDVERILDVVRDNGIAVSQIWITHGHIDHAGGAMELKDALGVEIIGPHEADRSMLANLESQAKRFGLAEAVRNCTPDRFLSEGDTVSFGEHVFEVLHCPGHAPGHVVYYNPAARFAHVGDVLFRGSVGRTDLPGGDHDALIASIKEKLLPLGDDVGFICGHGPGSRFGDERRGNPFLVWAKKAPPLLAARRAVRGGLESVRRAEMFLAVIADEGAGVGVEGAVAVAAIAEPFRAPRLQRRPILVIDDARLGIVGPVRTRARLRIAIDRLIVNRLVIDRPVRAPDR